MKSGLEGVRLLCAFGEHWLPQMALSCSMGNVFSDGWKVLVRKASVMQVLRWASEFAFHLLDVPDDPEGRQVLPSPS